MLIDPHRVAAALLASLIVAMPACRAPGSDPRLTAPTPPLGGGVTRPAIRPSVQVHATVSARMSVLGNSEAQVRKLLGAPSSAAADVWTYQHTIASTAWTRVIHLQDGWVSAEEFRTEVEGIDSGQTRAWLARSGGEASNLSVVGFRTGDVPEILGPPAHQESDGDATTFIYEWPRGEGTVRRVVRVEEGRVVSDILSILGPKGDETDPDNIGGTG